MTIEGLDDQMASAHDVDLDYYRLLHMICATGGMNMHATCGKWVVHFPLVTGSQRIVATIVSEKLQASPI